MAFDIIVFTQDELDNAINSGIRSIGLCDNSFALPPAANMSYTALGKTDITINLTAAEFNSMNIVCTGFTPVFTITAPPIQIMPLNPSSAASMSSYQSSYLTSYSLSSYRYISSFGYISSGSFSSYSSYQSSFCQRTSFAVGSEYEYIWVNGYGINLI